MLYYYYYNGLYEDVSYHKSITDVLMLWSSTLFNLFNVYFSSKNCPSVGCAPADNVVCRDANAFRTKIVLLNHILLCSY
jgi:hypothetical protein